MKERTAAVRSLENARQYMYAYQKTGGERFIKSNSELLFVKRDDETSGETVNGEIILSKSRQDRKSSGPFANRVYEDAPLKVPQPKVNMAPSILGSVLKKEESAAKACEDTVREEVLEDTEAVPTPRDQ
jgi:hypothetical protein